MRHRAFTLIEVLMVMAILIVMLLPFYLLALSEYRQFMRFSRRADIAAEQTRAANATFRLATRHSYRVDPDNHGARFADGSRVRWENGRVELLSGGSRRPLTTFRVLDFTVSRREGRLTLNFEQECPPQQGGQGSLVVRSIFQHPPAGELR